MEKFTIKQMLEAGVHYGHNTRRWNPKMAKYIYGTYNNVHIINLQKTAPLLENALTQIKNIVAARGRVLFVGTKKQAADLVKEYAEKCGQYYINNRWLGGTLTNWTTISNSINAMVKNEKLLAEGMEGYTKKERLTFTRETEKLQLNLGGIKNMGGKPDAIFIIDAKKEEIAIQEANKLNIPVIAVVDTNSNPDNVTYPIPGNDDAIRAITFYCELVSNAILEGLELEASLSKKNKLEKSEAVEKNKEIDEDLAKSSKKVVKTVKKEATAVKKEEAVTAEVKETAKAKKATEKVSE
ncbi:30S ribosomal protein S2 [Rickettsiales bacterium LUAb2]